MSRPFITTFLLADSGIKEWETKIRMTWTGHIQQEDSHKANTGKNGGILPEKK